MGNDFEIKVNRAALDDLFALDGPVIKGIIHHFVEPIAEGQKKRAPVDTGKMRNSVTIGTPEASDTEVTIDVGPTATTPEGFPYPLAVEFGSDGHAPKPFIRPSVGDMPSA